MTDRLRLCAVVPTHNHWQALGGVLDELCNRDIPVFLIDDGSDPDASARIAGMAAERTGIELHRFAANRGKGAAVLAGFQMASAAGFTHAIQIDADGQHDLNALSRLIALAHQHPDTLVSGIATYDASVPLGRKIGRWITHVWVWIETLSFQVRDSMCGFRIYPLAAVSALSASGARIGTRMDFDTEILVRLVWTGVPLLEVPVGVMYPPGNRSNFRMVADNWRISKMHTRLAFGMVANLRRVLAHPPRAPGQGPHWSWLMERGAYWGLRISAAYLRLFGRRGSIIALSPIIFYFYLSGGVQRRASRDFLTRAFAVSGIRRTPGFVDGFRHFMAFAERTIDAFAAWTGRMPAGAFAYGDAAALHGAIADPRGALFIVSHLGNIDMTRALLDEPTRRRLTILVHDRHARNYGRILREFGADAERNTIQVTEVGAETAVALKERVEAGSWIVLAGDRTPVKGQGRTSLAPFMGAPAPFPQGPYIMAALLECPVYLLFCLKIGDRYVLDAERFAERIELPRGERAARLDAYATRYAARLEHHALRAPFQWYNFFDFWAPPRNDAP